jgi:hypothetical protein
MPSAEAGFVAKVREQVAFLQHDQYNYDQLRIYVSGVARPWVFGPADEFEFDGDEVLVVEWGHRRSTRTRGAGVRLPTPAGRGN